MNISSKIRGLLAREQPGGAERDLGDTPFSSAEHGIHGMKPFVRCGMVERA
jgi:hypothetical protein